MRTIENACVKVSIPSLKVKFEMLFQKSMKVYNATVFAALACAIGISWTSIDRAFHHHESWSKLLDLQDQDFDFSVRNYTWFDIPHQSPPYSHASFLNSNGKRLHVKVYEKIGNKRFILFLHGLGAHVNRSPVNKEGAVLGDDYIWQWFLARGYDVYGYDAEGHGHSEGVRHYIADWKSHLRDAELFLSLVQKRRSAMAQYYIMGESFGGTIALHLSLRLSLADKNVCEKCCAYMGTIFVAPAFKPVLPSPPVTWLLRYIMAPLFPQWRPFFMPENLAVENIWEDEAMASWYETKDALSDPSGQLRLGTAVQGLLAVEAANEAIRKGLVRFPYACIHGSRDLVVNVEGSILLHKYSSAATQVDRDHERTFPFNAGTGNKSCSLGDLNYSNIRSNSTSCLAIPRIRKDLFIVEGGMHDLFGAPQTPLVLDYLINWMDAGFATDTGE